MDISVRELLTAIRDTLTVPHPERRTAEARRARLELIEARTNTLLGAIASYSGPSTATALEVAAAVRRVAERHPINYEPWQHTERPRAHCWVCRQTTCEGPDTGPTAHCTRLECRAPHDQHGPGNNAAGGCDTFTLADPTAHQD